MQIREALDQGVRLLEEERVPSARLTAEVLLMHALRCERAHLYAHPERQLNDTERVHYARYLKERMSGKPTQYVTGKQEFWGLEFRVSPAVLIPRPETEHVVEEALRLAREMKRERPRIVDAGTGSGCIIIALAHELPRARLVGTDISAPALAVAVENARRLQAPVTFCRCHLFSAIASESADLVVSNPPYVPTGDRCSVQREIRDFEPEIAVFAGSEGLEVYRELIPEAARVLRPGGALVMELGFTLADRVRALLVDGWHDVGLVPDLAGIPRVLAATKAREAQSHKE